MEAQTLRISSEPRRPVDIFCDDHPNETITNFCYSTLRPLCPSCINPHNKLMKQNNIFPEIDTIRNVKMNCAKRCQNAILALQAETNALENQILVNPQSVIEQGIFQIRRAQERLIAFINKYADGLAAEYERNIVDTVSKASSSGDPGEKIQSLIHELEGLVRNIDTQHCVPTLQKIYKIDFQALVERFRNDIQHTLAIRENLASNFAEVNVYEQKFQDITDDIERYLNIRTHEYKQVERPQQHQQHQQQHQQQQQQQQQKQQQYQPPSARKSPRRTAGNNEEIGFLQFHKEYRNDPSEEFNVTQPDYFEANCPRKYLHFFQNHENRLHYVDLTKLSKYSKTRFEDIDLRITFPIPPFHKSITLPNGDIYLIGGTDIDDSSRKLSTNYLFDWNSHSLIPRAPLNLPRSSFGICYLNNSIYVAGGLTNNSTFTRRCERYDVATNKWTQIATLNYDVLAPCMTSFGGKFIFKFGGYNQGKHLEPYIEKYDPAKNLWSVCRVRIELPSTIKPEFFKILSTSACVQINSKEIYVFGGYLEDNNSSNQTFVFRVNGDNDDNNPNNYVIKDIGVKSLTHPEAFWNNIPIVHAKNVYALQNVQTLEQEDVCLDDARRLICFNSIDWSTLA